MHTRKLSDLEVGAVGLGCMGMSWIYREAERDDDASVAVINQAIDAGSTLLDTADIYGDGHNESLVGRAVRGRRDEVVLATKLGLVVDDLSARRLHRDASPAHVVSACEASLRRLDVDVIDLLYLHRIDPAVPLADTWGAMASLVSAGKVRYLGLSEVSVEEAAAAAEIHPVTAIQSELSLWTRDAQGFTAVDGSWKPSTAPSVVDWCAENGVAFVPFAPLGRGFLTGAITTQDFGTEDFRAASPRFTASNLAANLPIADAVREVAARYGVTPAQVALAWVLSVRPHVIPIPGTKKPRYLAENIAAASLTLSAEDLASLTELPAPVGSRY